VAAAAWFGFAGTAGAAELQPCTAVEPPPGPTVEISGEGNLTSGGPARKRLRKAGVRQRLVKPANNFTGVPTFPVRNVNEGPGVSRVTFAGKLRLNGRKGRRLVLSGLQAVVRDKGRTVVKGRLAGRSGNLFRIHRGKIVRNADAGSLILQGGTARLTPFAAKQANRRFKIRRKAKKLRAGMKWGRFDLLAVRKVTVPPETPEGEAPEEPPVLTKPAGASDLTGGTISWRIRESFVRYLNSGTGTWAADGTTPGPAEAIDGVPPLVYSYGFPFTGGWTGSGRTAVYGSGTVGFRYCRNTINFAVSNPEIELAGDTDSRMIFRVKGLDGTAFPDSRAVMVQLVPSLGERTVNGNTTTIEDIPGYVPADSTGLFAGFYPPYPGNPDHPSAEYSRFGSVTITYRTP
jgi:hypothetical protein